MSTGTQPESRATTRVGSRDPDGCERNPGQYRTTNRSALRAKAIARSAAAWRRLARGAKTQESTPTALRNGLTTGSRDRCTSRWYATAKRQVGPGARPTKARPPARSEQHCEG